MRLTLIQLSSFASKWSKLEFTDEDLRTLEEMLIVNPMAGKVIPGTGGLRKIRFAPPSRHSGKRGGFRVVYAFFAEVDVVYFFTLYGKNEQVDLSPQEKKIFRNILSRLRILYSDQ